MCQVMHANWQVQIRIAGVSKNAWFAVLTGEHSTTKQCPSSKWIQNVQVHVMWHCAPLSSLLFIVTCLKNNLLALHFQQCFAQHTVLTFWETVWPQHMPWHRVNLWRTTETTQLLLSPPASASLFCNFFVCMWLCPQLCGSLAPHLQSITWCHAGKRIVLSHFKKLQQITSVWDCLHQNLGKSSAF